MNPTKDIALLNLLARLVLALAGALTFWRSFDKRARSCLVSKQAEARIKEVRLLGLPEKEKQIAAKALEIARRRLPDELLLKLHYKMRAIKNERDALKSGLEQDHKEIHILTQYIRSKEHERRQALKDNHTIRDIVQKRASYVTANYIDTDYREELNKQAVIADTLDLESSHVNIGFSRFCQEARRNANTDVNLDDVTARMRNSVLKDPIH